MCRTLMKEGWTLNDVEESDFETLVEVFCERNEELKKVDLVDYMKQERGLTMN